MVIGGVALACVIAFIFGYIVMHLWNWIMPDLFGLKTIGFWKAFGIVLLGKLVFGSFGHHPHHGDHGDLCGRGKFRKMKHLRRFHHDHPEIAENYEEYTEFWEKKGSEEFAEYLEKKRRDADGKEG
jgi:hypothetical protein